MEQSDSKVLETIPERSHHYRWKFWAFPDGLIENPWVLKESPYYFKTEAACVIDAKAHYPGLNILNTVVLSIVNEPRAAFPQYNTIESRKNSFGKWPPCMPFTPTQMSEAGFYYTGRYDQVICFSCGKGLYKWEPKDNPWVEHEKHSPNCHYLRTYATSLKST